MSQPTSKSAIAPTRREVPIHTIDLNDTRFKFRRNFNEETIRGIKDSAAKTGLLNPIKVWKQGDHITIIAGWQRTAAMMRARISITDNHMRRNFSDYETSLQMTTLNQRNHITPEKLAELYGCGVDRVYILLSVQKLSPDLRNTLEKGKISLYQAVIINRFPVSERSEILDKVLKEGRSVKWLRDELTDLKRHPLIIKQVADDPKRTRHALRIFQGEEYLDLRTAYWNLLGEPAGLPSPLSCEFTMSMMAQDCDPPYVCGRDAEWAILDHGRFPHGDKEDFDWEEVPLDMRDNWGFYCERCARLTFPGIVFHRDTYYSLPNGRVPARADLPVSDVADSPDSGDGSDVARATAA